MNDDNNNVSTVYDNPSRLMIKPSELESNPVRDKVHEKEVKRLSKELKASNDLIKELRDMGFKGNPKKEAMANDLITKISDICENNV